MMKKLLLLLLCVPLWAQAQLTEFNNMVPKDKYSTPIISGLGLPFLHEPTITNTTYDNTNRVALTFTGQDVGRQYRHLLIYNPSGTLGVYVCAGGNDVSSCTRDMWKAPATLGVADDFAYFGVLNSITYLYYRISSAGSVTPVIRWW